MSTWEPDPDAPLTDGCCVRIGDGPHEGTWWPLIGAGHQYSVIQVPHGCPLTVLREVVPEREWQTGDRVEDASGMLCKRRASDDADADMYPWLAYGDWLSDTDLTRPLTLLVPAEDRR